MDLNFYHNFNKRQVCENIRKDEPKKYDYFFWCDCETESTFIADGPGFSRDLVFPSKKMIAMVPTIKTIEIIVFKAFMHYKIHIWTNRYEVFLVTVELLIGEVIVMHNTNAELLILI